MNSGASGLPSAMARALELADLGRGRTWPNPMVGCVILRDGELVGEGFHRRAGEAHAEVEALRMAGPAAKGGTLFVTLEPCCHHGRTPPCTDAILHAGIERVIFGMEDPDPRMRGRGVAQLQRAGVRVEGPVDEEACRRLNEAWILRLALGRPFVTMKVGQSLDGRIATRTGESRWITGEEARADARRERALVSAVAAGVGTVLSDDPALTARDGAATGGDEPMRVVFDSSLRCPLSARVFGGSGAVVLCVEGAASSARAEDLRALGVRVLAAGDGPRVDVRRGLDVLDKLGVVHLLVEGGGDLHGSFLDAGLVDRALIYVAPTILGGRGARPAVAGEGAASLAGAFRGGPPEVRRIGDDLRIELRRAPPS